MSLIELVQDERPYRTVFRGHAPARPAAIACQSEEAAAARRWAGDNLGRAALIVPLDRPAADGADEIGLAALANEPQLLAYVFGRNPRRKAVLLAQAGVREAIFCADPQFPNHKHDPDLLKTRRRVLQKVFDALADDESRRTFASLVKHRITGDHGYMRIARYAQYEHPVVRAERGEWVCDCGALTGKTSFRFARQVGAEGRVYAFEPDPTNHAKMKAKLPTRPKQDAPITLLNLGVSDAPGELKFRSNQAGASKVATDGDVTVRVQTLDGFAEAFAPSGPGLLSFDIEGFEFQALTGGERMITRLRPKLQVSIYHRAADLWRLPLWAMERLPGYRFYIGHHDAHHSETDLYAIPEERLAPAAGDAGDARAA